jgi:hypothetical protein
VSGRTKRHRNAARDASHSFQANLKLLSEQSVYFTFVRDVHIHAPQVTLQTFVKKNGCCLLSLSLLSSSFLLMSSLLPSNEGESERKSGDD